MKSFAANLSTIFTEVPLIERFKKAKDAGFSFVECQFPYDYSIAEIKRELEANQLKMVLINFPAGDWANGERGLASLPNRREEFKDSVALGIKYAKNLGVTRLHCLAGNLETGRERLLAKETYKENLLYAATEMAKEGLTLLIEPINSMDMPGYFLSDVAEAAQIISELGMSNIKLQLDFYHLQKMRGNLIETFQRYYPVIGHIQIADVPERHEPGTGEINYERVLRSVMTHGYNGYIGLEYTPSGKSEDSFAWMNGFKQEDIAK